jgi:radical SAM protein with 4Fe4S-binding SPASM domain
MTAKHTPRIRVEGRTKLQDVIPLDTPLHVFIDPSAACNFKCGFCFHADPKNTHHEIMKWETFTKTVDQLKQFPKKLKAVRVYGFGEPLLNRKLPEMIRYIKQAEVTDFVEFTTNGWWLNPGLNRKLIDAGLDAITISIPGLYNKEIKESCGKDVDFQNYYDNIVDLCMLKEKCRVHVKMTNRNLQDGDIVLFETLFEDIADEISIDNIVPIWPDVKKDIGLVGSPNKNIYNLPLDKVSVEVCPYIFYHLTIHANGEISTCFVDWNHQNVLGNVNTNTLFDVWNGAKLRAMRIRQLQGKREGICSECTQLVYGQPDNLDPYKEEIFERLI